MEEATKIVIELDLAPGAEERLKKFYDLAAKKSEKYGGGSSSKEQKKKAQVTIDPEVLKKWEEMGGANENRRSGF
jgi:hypothetical protein